jgi:hypothetical protein
MLFELPKLVNKCHFLHKFYKGGRTWPKHLIPSDPELWKLDRFEEFIEARKKLIREKFKYLLVPMASSGP